MNVMVTLHISGEVFALVGEDNIGAMADRLPAHVQCWGCGQFIDTRVPGPACLSVVAERGISITTFSHPDCGPSRVFTLEQYDQVGKRLGAAAHAVPPTGRHEALFVDGEHIL